MRVPTINVSIVDLTFTAGRATSAEELNEAVLLASQNELNGVLACTDEPLVSIDFNHDPVSSTLDAGLTKVSGNLAKVCAWYDNEWGYSNRMLDLSLALANAKQRRLLMTLSVRCMTDIPLKGKRVLIREDLNTPIQNGSITSDR